MPSLKVIDMEGLRYLWNKINMQDYPNNDVLVAVINAIDNNKADKIELEKYLLIDDYVSDVTGGFDSSLLVPHHNPNINKFNLLYH